ncbi:hypothetical protein [Terribacillus saccharophilus]|uniref:Uncharacterized protein n=1 Tax=Terribacillus saccharophilus TaxID=361277 RepID=A0A268ACA2_9BACI|nr:hypothetical protein [Terribacillus saccharophilus]PAD21738.1 hypothetical protein CHH64_07175 [Terribacillus saccharophilus]PAF19860.1 hypothetical protein CHH51_00875 [Terribacillus saccharophilus]PAF34406.1 hypothetical protein CHH69_15940 [Terribacillus saccharophilus]PAF37812.1 hypothetical protein CHH58_06355 [Terribacillus saccharophilus]
MYLDETKRYRFIGSVPFGKYFMVRIYDLELQQEYTISDRLLSQYTDKPLKEFYLQIKRNIYDLEASESSMTWELGDMQQRLIDFLDEEEEDDDDAPIHLENVVPFRRPHSEDNQEK